MLDQNPTEFGPARNRKPEASTPGPLKTLEDWWSENRTQYSARNLFDAWGTPTFYTHDSNFPSYVTNATNLTDILKEKRLIPFDAYSMVLPLDAEKVREALPPYLKLSPIDIDESHRVYMVNLSREILPDGGKFLFRGEGAETLDKATLLVTKRLKEGRMISHAQSVVHATRDLFGQGFSGIKITTILLCGL